jgi:hypothetical protein
MASHGTCRSRELGSIPSRAFSFLQRRSIPNLVREWISNPPRLAALASSTLASSATNLYKKL